MVGARKSKANSSNHIGKDQLKSGETWQKILIYFPLSVFAVAIMFLRVSYISPDGSLYMAIALNICKGLGITLPDGSIFIQKPPLFPALEALAFKIFSPKIEVVSMISRIFGALNVILVYLIGLRLNSNRVSAFVGACLFFSSPFFLKFSTFTIMATTTLFTLLLGMLLFIHATDKRSYLLLFLSCLVFVVSFYFKQVAILFLPIPILLWIFFRKIRENFDLAMLLLFVLVFLLLIAPWYLYQNLVGVGGRGESQYLEMILDPSIAIVNMIPAMKVFFRLNLLEMLNIYEIIIISISLLYMIMRVKDRSTTHFILLSSWFLFFVPMIPAIVFKGFSLRQVIFPFAISFIVMGDLYHWLSEKVRGFPISRGVNLFVKSFLVFLVALPFCYGLWEFSGWYFKLQEKKDRIDWNWNCDTTKDISVFINNYVPEGSKIMSAWAYSDQIYFNTSGDYPIYLMPVRKLRLRERGMPTLCDNFPIYREYPEPYDKDGPIIFAKKDLLNNRTDFDLKDKVFFMYVGEFLDRVKLLDIDYIIFTHNYKYSPDELKMFLDENPLFEKVYEIERASVYRVIK